MKKLLFIFLFLYSLVSSAQEVDQLYFPKYKFAQINEVEIKSYLKSYFKDIANQDIQLSLQFENQTIYSKHFTFDIVFKQIPILNATIKVNTDLQGNIISIKKENLDLAILDLLNTDQELKAWQQVNINHYANQFWAKNRVINTTTYKVFHTNHIPMIVIELHAWSKTEDNTLVLDIDGNPLFEYNNLRYLNIDTIVNVKVFNPDPLTTSNQIYGGIYKDDNDANSTWMDPTYLSTTMDATFDNSTNTFYLENQYIKIDDIEAPNLLPVTSTIPTFNFNRSESGFEDVNTVYHITNFHNYISSLGYDTLMDLQILVDTHGQFGADNSVFASNGGNPTIRFGTGGVDDAEDADVIIHEYCHGISWSANKNVGFSFERSGLDEGLADYFATSYSRNISSFNWVDMFSWDGHNEFWNGRTAATSNNYPSTGNIYAVGEIWNAAMSGIWTDLGNIITDKLMLESLHYFTNNTKLPEAALYILQADTVLFGGIHTSTICNRFKSKLILDNDCKPVNIERIESNTTLSMINSLGFLQNTSDAKLVFPQLKSGTYTIYDLTGKLIKTSSFTNQQDLSFSPSDFGAGFYILKVKIDNVSYSFKLNKL